MSFGFSLSSDMKIDILETTDIGGTTATLGTWLDMSDFESMLVYVEIGTWNASDDLDECRIEAASDSAGTGNVEVTTDASGGNYDTDNPVDADGDFVAMEIRNENLPAGKKWVNFVVGEGGNTGVDNVNVIVIRHNSKTKQKELNGAAVTGSKVYVTPNT